MVSDALDITWDLTLPQRGYTFTVQITRNRGVLYSGPEGRVIDEAIALYQRLLEEDPGLVEQSQQMLKGGMSAEGVHFRGRTLRKVLRPHLITAEQYAQLCEACRLVLSAMRKAGEAMLQDPTRMEPLRLSAAERRLVMVDPGYPAISAISRLDSFMTGGSPAAL
jgi:hypothetical protein